MKHINLLTAFLLLILSTLTANAQHDYVDLGLPSGTLWATTNVGAINPADYGDYFAWGETEPKSDYSWSTYKWCKGSPQTLTKYCNQSENGYNGFTDDLTELQSEDDAATANWGSEWQMPSKGQFEELINSDYTTTEWTAKTGKEGFLNYGMLITSKINGKSIFLPASGRRNGTKLEGDDVLGFYCSRMLVFVCDPYSLVLDQDGASILAPYRYQGLSVRPVRVPEKKEYDYVDLGLPSGTLWATCNVGASSPEERGDYFAWGETEPKDYYEWNTYKWCNGSWKTLTKYCSYSEEGYNGFTDGLKELLPEDDAATVNWGAPWHMPSKEQIREIYRNCTRKRTQRNGVEGWLFTGPNGGQIFLPGCGYRSAEENIYPTEIYYWSCSIEKTNSNYASILYSTNDNLYLDGIPRDAGLSVRAVREPDAPILIVRNIELSLTSVSLLIDESRTIKATVQPVTATNQNVIWSSSNTSIASVDQSGNVTAKAIGSCTITCSATDGSGVKAECQVTVTTTNSETINGRDFVDLGLPSGTLWATCNVGANSPEEYGDHFAWGETESKSDYSWGTYKYLQGGYSTLTKYCTQGEYGYNGFTDDLTELQPEDDAATANWGSEWQMPSKDQFSEIFKYEHTTKVWTTFKGVNGYKFTSKVNGNSIFMPAAGKREGTSFDKEGSCGYYWARSLDTGSPHFAYDIYFHSYNPGSGNESRCYGKSVRPVRAPEKREVYTEFVESTGTLTYYFDDKREKRAGVTEPYDPVGNPDVARFTGYFKKVVKAVVDPSMKDAPLTSMRSMFYGGMNPETWVMQSLRNMTTIEGLENLNTATVTDMNSMFAMCEKLTTLDLSTFNTSNVTTFNGMFTSCDNLELVDVTSFDISKVTDMEMMFISCPKLTTICCFNDWSTSSAKSNYMFSGCKSLVGDKGTVFEGNVIDKTYARPDGGTGAPGYFTSDTMTGIKEMKNEERRIKNDIYNLSGQRLQKLQKGINIIGDSNGTSKKVLIK